jgi:hypothetical protein
MHGLFPTGTKEWLLESIQSSILSSIVDQGMINGGIKIEIKPMVSQKWYNII